mgnify:CR=1 FL=1|tara:strand:+ start:3084 stop:3320 length:237 start_codon:yes stop_codon:yes gene_type:complete
MEKIIGRIDFSCFKYRGFSIESEVNKNRHFYFTICFATFKARELIDLLKKTSIESLFFSVTLILDKTTKYLDKTIIAR